jgi:hypothetical protein
MLRLSNRIGSPRRRVRLQLRAHRRRVFPSGHGSDTARLQEPGHMPTTALNAETVTETLLSSFAGARGHDQPYRHWFVENCLPQAGLDAANGLPFAAPALGGVSGKREVHNATRRYFDAENRAKFPVASAMADALQGEEVTRTIEKKFGSRLAGTYLRIEYAQDTDGFWLEPHTDLGVKLFTFLLYLSPDAQHADLGTDIYDNEKKHVGRSPFKPGSAMIFVPSNITYHGFEPRKITGVRKSIIVNYVSNDWKAREQLAFPDRPIKH